MKLSMIKHLRTALFASALLTICGAALADNCKAPKVQVKNDKAATIKITKIQYFDTCDQKWRTEDVAVTEIAPGSTRTFTDDLEYVGNCAISKFKLYRAVRQTTGNAYGSYEWGGELVPDQGSSQRCNTGVTYTIHAHD
jgi:hypothetical protein